MLRKFFSGLMFGAGFFVAVVLLGWLLAHALVTRGGGQPFYFGSSPVPDMAASVKDAGMAQPPLYDLPVEHQIERASVIIVTRFEAAEDGRRKAVVADILKRAPGTRFHYQPGDEFPSSSYYPRQGDEGRGEGTVVLFEGLSAEMRYSTTYRGDRVSGLGDIPLTLLREKCNRAGG